MRSGRFDGRSTGRANGLLRHRGMMLMAVLGVCAACAGSGGAMEEGDGPPVPTACTSVEEGLVPGATLAGMAGRYRLTLVQEGAEGRGVAGTLVLTPRPADRAELDGWTTPLQGVADIDLEVVGAQRAGALDSTDPRAPGVLVLEAHGSLEADGSEPEILLRFGSTANRTEPVAFDEAFTVLRVRTMGEEGGFAGSWRSGVRATFLGGHFCAQPA